MTQVNVTINGRQYRMACEDGEEGHLAHLAEDLDERIARLRLRFGEIGDTRLTVMAALTLADELAEANKKLQGLEPNSPPCRRRGRIRRSHQGDSGRDRRPRSTRRPSESRAWPEAAQRDRPRRRRRDGMKIGYLAI